MQVITCKKCGKIFQYLAGPPICPKCKKIEEEVFQQVKTFLRENRGATMEQVSEETGASIGLIQRFLREGRLEVTPDSAIALTCEQCGTKIYTGRFCDHCKNQISQGFASAAKSMQPSAKEKPKDKERMRFLNK